MKTGVDHEAVVAAYRDGATIREIARLLGTHRGLVRRVLVTEGVSIRLRGGRPLEVDTTALVADDRAQLPPAEVARRHGISVRTLHERLADAGELADGRRRPSVDAAEIRRRQRDGQTLEEIAHDVGLAVGTLRGRLTWARAELGPQGHFTPLVARWQGRVSTTCPPGVSERNWAVFRRVVAGEPQRGLARELGVTQERIGQIARQVDRALRRELP